MVCGVQGCCLVVSSNGLEQAFSNKFDQVGELFECSKKLEGNQEELHEKTQVALNVVVESRLSQGNWLRDSLFVDVNSLCNEVAALREQVVAIRVGRGSK